ncbi:MAG: alpha/beta hydrolase [Chloroflexi bacterium]|nr:alpha/beta hydrolase [Chloroflexota bacterium]
MPARDRASTVPLHHIDEGSGGPALLFIHGWLRSTADWSKQARAFRGRHRVIRADLRGHGRSPAPAGGYTRRELAADVVALMDELDLASVVLVGHSMGCGVALEVAAAAPRRVCALALVDGVGPREPLTRAEIDAHPFMSAVSGADYRERIMELAGGGISFTPGSDPRLVRRIPRESVRTPQHVAIGSLRGAVLANRSAAWGRLRQPILCVASSNTRISAAGVREVLPEAEFGQVVGSGHWVQLEAAPQLHAMLRAFLKGVEQRCS